MLHQTLKPFRFKQFVIHHDRAAMKVGTDGVLLGAWVNPDAAKTILDIGTGTGVIALMLAQRTSPDVVIDAIELEPQACDEAKVNISQSPWPAKVTLHAGAVQQFHSSVFYDVIVSNPPYFQNSYKPPDEKRMVTRHTDTLSFIELILAAHRLLSVKGKFNVVLPYQEGIEFIKLANAHGLACSRQWSVRSRNDKPIERWLLEFTHEALTVDTGEITLYQQGEEWTDAYKDLTKEFYLKA